MQKISSELLIYDMAVCILFNIIYVKHTNVVTCWA